MEKLFLSPLHSFYGSRSLSLSLCARILSPAASCGRLSSPCMWFPHLPFTAFFRVTFEDVQGVGESGDAAAQAVSSTAAASGIAVFLQRLCSLCLFHRHRRQPERACSQRHERQWPQWHTGPQRDRLPHETHRSARKRGPEEWQRAQGRPNEDPQHRHHYARQKKRDTQTDDRQEREGERGRRKERGGGWERGGRERGKVGKWPVKERDVQAAAMLCIKTSLSLGNFFPLPPFSSTCSGISPASDTAARHPVQ